jgi:tetratricopeptide (TPR) repeat protein
VGAYASREASGFATCTEGPLRSVVELIRLEQDEMYEELTSRSAWLDISNLAPKGRREKLRLSQVLHTKSMVETLLREARSGGSPKEAEDRAHCALIVAQLLPQPPNSAEMKADYIVECYSELANALRRAANWKGAKEYLRRARELLASSGSGTPSVEGHLLSVCAALEADLGNTSAASSLLDMAEGLFEQAANWNLIGRTLVQHAYILADADESERALKLANRALALLPPSSIRLRLFAESIRVNCLLGLGALGEALVRFQGLTDLHEQYPDSILDLRRQFMAARILEGLGQVRKAEKIFLEVINGDLEQGLVKDFLLDVVFLFGVYVRRGQLEAALSLCRRTSREIQLLEEREETSKSACDQMREVWSSLEIGLRQGIVEVEVVSALRDYVRDHWKTPAPELPAFAIQTKKRPG